MRAVPVPCTAIAHDLGQKMVKNVVALGALMGATRLFPPETLVAAVRQALASKPQLLHLNEEALARGPAAPWCRPAAPAPRRADAAVA